MHTVELLQRAIQVAEMMGYGIRQEWLGGTAGGACEIAGQKWIFVDVSLSVSEQLEQLTNALQDDPFLHNVSMPEPLRAYMGLRKTA